jgi:hypothetical protein
VKSNSIPAAPRVRVTIDRLVLRGFPPSVRAAVTRSLESALGAEIGRLAADGQLGPGRAVASLRLPPLRFAGAPTPATIGARAGRTLARGVRP